MLKRFLVFLAVCAAARGEPATRDGRLEPEPLYTAIAQRFAVRFPREHLSRIPMGDGVAERTWTNYLASLDYERVYFLEEDVRRFLSGRDTIDDELQDGDVRFAYRIFETFLARLRDRVAYVEHLLQAGFELDKEESFVWKRKDAPWVGDAAEWNELWRKKIKNEYVRRIVARELADAAKPRAEDKPPAAEGGTNTVAEKEDTPDDDASLSPEEFISKRYRQQLTVLEDCDAAWVLQRYLTAFAMAYDPHSNYMSPNTLEDFEIEMKLSLFGIGALLQSEDGAAKVVRVIPGGPADQDQREKRLRAGDKIIAVAQDTEPSVDVLHWPLQKIVRLIRGPKGSRVVLTVIPASDPSGATLKKVDLIRDEVKLEEQAASGKVHEVKGADQVARKIGIIRLPAFYANLQAASREETGYKSAATDVEAIIEDMKAQGVKGLLLDLRGNGGGSLVEAIRMTGLFIPVGPAVQVRERFGVRPLADRDPKVAFAGPLVILVNRLSASASEIVAGALQDYGRAIVVGDSKTHGKGTVQSVVGLADDKKLGAIKVTTASYYRISGGSTQLKGVLSDIVVSSPWDMMETGEEQLDNAMPWTQVTPASYSPLADLHVVVSELRLKSLDRRREDPRYDAYGSLLERIREMNRARELPLNLAERKRLSETEQKLSQMHNELDDMDNANPDTAALQRDLVLSEAAAILADFVALRDKVGSPPEPPPQDVTSTTRALAEWLRSLL